MADAAAALDPANPAEAFGFLPQSWRPHAVHGLWTAIRLGLRVSGDPVGPILHGREVLRDPTAVYGRLRAQGPVVFSRLPNLAIATSHTAVADALRELHVGPPPTGEAVAPLIWDSPLSPSLLDLDPPDHTRIRKLVAQVFTPRAISHLRELAEDVTRDLLDEMEGRDEVDLVAELATPLPVRMICEMLGVPTDQIERFTEWGEALALSLEPSRSPAEQVRISRAGQELRAFFEAEFTRRRAAAHPGDDILGRLLAAREGEDRLSDRELVATCILLLGAGFETTVNLIGSGVLALLRNPGQRRLLVDDPSLLPNAVDELLRLDSPVQMTGRLAWDDVELDGVRVPRGTNVMVLLGSANHDPAQFPDPERLDVTRHNARTHMSFSSGIHHCLGAPLARMEGEVAIGQLLERFPAIRHSAPAVRRTTRVLRGLRTLPVRLKG